MFHVWDGNHRLLAWFPLIEWNHKFDPLFHVPVKSIILCITDVNRKEILHAMTDWNKKNEVDHVAQHWTHDLRRIQQFGTMPFEELKQLLSDDDYKKSIEEWGRPTKNKKWYHMTMDAFINFMYQREIAKSQEEAIRQYRDSLVSGDGRMAEGSSEDLIRLASLAVKKTKTQLTTDMVRHLLIADPRNGADFINEVARHFDVYQTKPEMQAEKVQLIATARVAGKYKLRWLKWWNMSKESRVTFNFPKSPCSIEELRPWVDVAAFWAEESGKLLARILEEDKITLSPTVQNIHLIERWIERWSILLWKRAFRDIFSKSSTFSKTKEFLAQADTEKALRRTVMRYFVRELLPLRAIQRLDMPARFAKWSDLSSSECVFTLDQRKTFPRPHLVACPWYIDLSRTDKCPSEEASLKASCDQEVLVQSTALVVLEDQAGNVDDGLTDKERNRLLLKKTREKEKERLKEKKEREDERETKRKEAEERRQLSMKVKKFGLKQVLEDEGISPSGSSRPASSTGMPAPSSYSIPTFDTSDDTSNILIINEGADVILGQFEKLAEDLVPQAWETISDFVKKHQGNKKREQHGIADDSPLVDLVFIDVPENLPVPGILPAGEVPHSNKLKIRTKPNKRQESPWIHKAFEFASTRLQDDGAVLVFYPDSRFISNEIVSWAEWANFQEEDKWFVSNELPLTMPDYVGRTVKYFMAKLFVRKESTGDDPDDCFPRSAFSFNQQEQLLAQGIDLPNDGTIKNVVTLENLTLRAGMGFPWRGAREKSVNLFQALVDLCSEEEDIVMDLTAGTGASIRACCSLNRHIIALEPEVELYEEVLLPLLPSAEEVDSETPRDVEPQQPRKRSIHGDDEEEEKKSAPKRKYAKK